MSSALDALTADGTMSVDVAQIERQLRALWQRGGETISRACLFNFVVWCGSETDAERATAVISELTGRHPCRAIVLVAEPERADSRLTASLKAHCRLADGGRKQVCCEQITLGAAAAAVSQLAPTVLSLLEGDLPTVLWWRGNFLEQLSAFERMRAVADRVLFDTSAWPQAHRQLQRLHQTIREPPPPLYADLSWTRLALWRKLIADCFDEPPFRAMLAQVERVVVRHGGGPGARVRALLYAGWLAARLGWTADGARDRVRVEPCEGDDVAAIGIESVELRAGDASALVRKDLGESVAQAVVSMPQMCSLPRRQAFAPMTETALLSQQLDQVAPHTAYERALQLAVALEQTA